MAPSSDKSQCFLTHSWYKGQRGKLRRGQCESFTVRKIRCSCLILFNTDTGYKFNSSKGIRNLKSLKTGASVASVTSTPVCQKTEEWFHT